MKVLRGLNMNLLLVLDALLTEKSVTRAGEVLGVSQSAVSRSLRALRVVFNDPILVRHKNDMLPTARARALHGPLRDALGGLREVVEGQVGFDPRTAQRDIAIGGGEFATLLFERQLSALLQEAPGLNITMMPFPYQNLVEALANRDLYLAIGASVYEHQELCVEPK